MSSRTDHFTTTPAAAGAFESHGAGLADRPSRSDLAGDIALDAFAARRRAAREARAAGQYVPSPRMGLRVALVALGLTQRGIVGAEVTAAREGVVGVLPGRSAPEDVAAALADLATETAVADGVVWAKVDLALSDPFAHPSADTDSPF